MQVSNVGRTAATGGAKEQPGVLRARPGDVLAKPVAAGHDARPCPIGRAASMLGDRWILLILRDATIGVTRFDHFRDHLDIAENILASRLRRLVDEGLLVKVPYRDGRRTRQEYRLTQAGADLAPILRALGDWGHRHTRAGAAGAAGKPSAAGEPGEPMRVIHDKCGGEVGTDQICSSCGTAVGRDQQAWLRPWHSPDPVRLAQPVL
jgi:DNA-binding HxlR family transcriptional regulator